MVHSVITVEETALDKATTVIQVSSGIRERLKFTVQPKKYKNTNGTEES